MPKRVEVWLKQPNKRIDAYYDYAVPKAFDKKVAPGIRVAVPFSNSGKLLEGFITAVKTVSDYEAKLKPIEAVIDDEPVLTTAQIRLCDWIRRYYCSMFYEALAPFTAPVRVIQKRAQKGSDDQPSFEAYAPKRKGHCDRDRTTLPKHPELSSDMAVLLGDYCKTIDLDHDGVKPAFFFIHDPHQRFEAYCALASMEASAGRQTVILYPETSLLGFYRESFEGRFGNSGALCYGTQKPSARYRTWAGVRDGKIQVVFGSRAALFLPFQNLGLIIIDTPWDSSYTSMVMPRYDTLRTAKAYCRFTGATLVCGGSVVSVGIMAEIRAKKMHCFTIPGRRNIMPAIIDMQSELRRGNRRFISAMLDSAIQQALKAHQKCLLMLNRSGQAGYVLCRDCGHVIRCDICGVAMKVFDEGILKCGCCGKTRLLPTDCPECGSHRFRPMGIGTAKAEMLLKAYYPKARILRIDGEDIQSPSDYVEMDEIVSEGNWDLIIGTRMLLKGFDFGKVSVVGALLMDNDLNTGDYTASEEAFLMYRQFFDLSEYKVIGQTYQKDHPVIAALTEGNTAGFYDDELQYRKRFGYPPAGHVIMMTVMDPDKTIAENDAKQLYGSMTDRNAALVKEGDYRIYPPVYIGGQPVSGRSLYKIMIKTGNLTLFHDSAWKLINDGEIEKLHSKVAIEVDPRAAL